MNQPHSPQKTNNPHPPAKIIKMLLVATIAAIIIFLGVEFIPGFFGGGKPHRSETSDGTTKTNSTTSPTDQLDQSSDQNIQYTTKPTSLLGLDTAVESPHFTIYCHKADEAKAKELLKVSEKDYPALTKLFPKTPKTEILLTYDASEYVNVFTAAPPWGAETYKDPNTSAGSFCPGCTKSLGGNTEYIYMLRPQNRSFAHELAHRYYWSSYPNLSKDNSLIWLNEGQAVYVQNKVAQGPGGFSSNLSKVNNSPIPESFSALNQLQQKGDYASTEKFYDLVGLMASYVHNKTNGGLTSFITDLNNTQDLNKTCQNKFGYDSNQLFTKWSETVIKTSASNPSDFLTNYIKTIQ